MVVRTKSSASPSRLRNRMARVSAASTTQLKSPRCYSASACWSARSIRVASARCAGAAAWPRAPTRGGDPVAAQQLASQALENLRQQQASSLAYFDTFWMIAVLTFVVSFAVLFMKRSVAEQGGHVASE